MNLNEHDDIVEGFYRMVEYYRRRKFDIINSNRLPPLLYILIFIDFYLHLFQQNSLFVTITT